MEDMEVDDPSILSKLECPVCMDLVTPNRMPHGPYCTHKFCVSCISRLNTCALCRAPMTYSEYINSEFNMQHQQQQQQLNWQNVISHSNRNSAIEQTSIQPLHYGQNQQNQYGGEQEERRETRFSAQVAEFRRTILNINLRTYGIEIYDPNITEYLITLPASEITERVKIMAEAIRMDNQR